MLWKTAHCRFRATTVGTAVYHTIPTRITSSTILIHLHLDFIGDSPSNTNLSNLEWPQQQIKGSRKAKAASELRVESKCREYVGQTLVHDGFAVIGRNQAKGIDLAVDTELIRR